MNVLVTYESRGGRTKRAADAIAEAARATGATVVVSPVSDATSERVEEADVLFVGSWVEGFIVIGVGPAGPALHWIATLPALGGKPAAVFCTYAFNPRGTLAKLEAALAKKGAKVIGARAFHRKAPGAGADGFVKEVLRAAR